MISKNDALTISETLIHILQADKAGYPTNSSAIAHQKKCATIREQAQRHNLRFLQEFYSSKPSNERERQCNPEVTGWFSVKWREDGGLRVSGQTVKDVAFVIILINGFAIRAVPVRGCGLIYSFRFSVNAKAVSRLTKTSLVQVVSEQGVLVTKSGDQIAELITDGDGEFIDRMNKGHIVSKKGGLIKPIANDPRRLRMAFETVARLDELLRDEIGSRVWIAHGTLLGLFRDGRPVPGDDDVDAAYVSRHESVSDVITERVKIIQILRRSGYSAQVGESGVIKVGKVGSSGKLIDLMPGWFMDGKLWIQAFTMLDMQEKEIFPTGTIKWEEVEVPTPQNVEQFLLQKYGPHWKIPDPAYQAKRPKSSAKVLASLRPSKKELEAYGKPSVENVGRS